MAYKSTLLRDYSPFFFLYGLFPWLLQIKNSCLISTVMKPTPFLEQVYHMMVQLLNDQGHEELATQISEIFELPEWIEMNNPLLKKGLVKVVKEYVRSNEKMLKYFANRRHPQEEEQEEVVATRTRKRSQDIVRQSVSPKVEAKVRAHKHKVESPLITKVASPKPAANGKSGNSGWMAKFEKPKTLEQLNEIQNINKHAIVEEVEVNEPKPSKKQKIKAKVESSDFESEEDSFELEPKKKQKKEVKAEKKEEKKEKKEKNEKKSKKKQTPQQEEIEEQVKEEAVSQDKQQKIVKKSAAKEYYPTQTDNGPKKFFSRINPDAVGPIREQLRDNSFQAKGKFGQQADHWGQFGYDKLKDTRGDSFKKTKGKLKNRAFQGALMDINKINSIPIL